MTIGTDVDKKKGERIANRKPKRHKNASLGFQIKFHIQVVLHK